MVNPIVVAGCLAIGFGGLAFAFVGGDSRADKRRAAVARSDAKAQNASANVDRAARKKQIADGLRDIEKKGKQRVSLAARIDQAGLSISTPAVLARKPRSRLVPQRLRLHRVEKRVAGGSCRRDRHRRAAAAHAGPPAHSTDQQVHRQLSDRHRHHRARHQVRPAARRHHPDRRGRKSGAGQVGVSPGRRNRSRSG